MPIVCVDRHSVRAQLDNCDRAAGGAAKARKIVAKVKRKADRSPVRSVVEALAELEMRRSMTNQK